MKGPEIIVADCRVALQTLDVNSIDAIVTDPPYGLAFMGAEWDRAVPGPEFWLAMLRVAKPGAHLVAFGGTRTFHRMACAIEDAGWELRDTIAWLYGSGFPKSEAQTGDWTGWGTGLKPGWEPIILARKPTGLTVAGNLAAHGVGALNIDGCRIEAEARAPVTGTGGIPCRNDPRQRPTGSGKAPMMVAGTNGRPFHADHVPTPTQPHPGGRWPANVCHDGSAEVLAGFPAQAGARAPVHTRNGDKFRATYGAFAGCTDEAGSTFHSDTGSAARFFYCANASRADRNEGCEAFAAKPLNWSSGEASPGTFQAEGTDRTSPNFHPTVKPTDLMRWLVRLVTPPGGLVLDPFAGSGSTGKAAVLESMGFVGIELDQAFGDIARARIQHAQRSLLA